MERLHISFFGATNSGKSTLVNAICGQEVSLVSPIPGTTTDPVRKLVELPGLGPCVLIDTAGLDDTGALGPERERRTRAILDETDIAVLLESPEVLPVVQSEDHQTQKPRQNAPSGPSFGPPATPSPNSAAPSRVIPDPSLVIPAPSRVIPDLIGDLSAAKIPIVIYRRGESVASLLERIAAARPKEEERFLTGGLVKPGDTVLLVMPQDSEAPKGRLILPQVQVLRELLDRGCVPVCCTPQSLQDAIKTVTPNLVITDSQVFGLVDKAIPAEWPLTSFSVLLAGAKGDLKVFVQGARAIDSLKPGARVLIAEACTHVPDSEDIGRVKIPALLRRRFEIPDQVGNDVGGVVNDAGWVVNDVGGDGNDASVTPGSTGSLQIDIAAGNDFPEDLSQYDLIIHCGACVASATIVRSRIRKALLAGVPITNYGLALAHLNGILGRISLP
ncbi:MAG: 50S ribosome-binding GTPase [Bacteroidales bacterium]|nr:50S ribosome-binding GTPase [Bacteroidales bacterium]